MSTLSDVKRVLVKARNILSDPKRWTRGQFRRTVLTDEGSQFAYCALGAIKAATGEYTGLSGAKGDRLPDITDGAAIKDEARRWLRQHMHGTISGFNDDTSNTHEDLIRAFDQTIAELRTAVEKEGATS